MKIRVPATSANLGPGFDVLGLALNLYNEYEFIKSDSAKITEGGKETSIKDNLIYESYRKTFKKLNEKEIPCEIKVTSNIPRSRGLGSSSSCIVGGVVGAYLTLNRKIDREEILQIAAEIEGHPDNVAPAIFGNITVSVNENGKNIANVIEPKNNYKFLAFIPDFLFSTSDARKVLPNSYSREDAIFNISRTAFLISSLILGEDENLKISLEDKIHQDYRARLIPDFETVFEFLKNNTLGCYLSGAGPTIMGINNGPSDFIDSFSNLSKDLSVKWNILELKLNTKGFEIIDWFSL